jgi:hypothetical protein
MLTIAVSTTYSIEDVITVWGTAGVRIRTTPDPVVAAYGPGIGTTVPRMLHQLTKPEFI